MTRAPRASSLVSPQEARLHLQQMRKHRALYEVKGAHRVLLVGEGAFFLNRKGWGLPMEATQIEKHWVIPL